VTFYFHPLPNKSFERTARQRAFHQPCMVSFGLSLSGGQPLNSSVGRVVIEVNKRVVRN
jgi:hypothetical protein